MKRLIVFTKGVILMILLTILTLISIILAVVAIAFLSLGGAVGIILFGDIIVCVLALVFLIKKLCKKK